MRGNCGELHTGSSNSAILKHQLAYCSGQARDLIAVLVLRNPIGQSNILVDFWSLDKDSELVYHGDTRAARRDLTGGLCRRIRYQPELSANKPDSLMIMGIIYYALAILGKSNRMSYPKTENTNIRS